VELEIDIGGRDENNAQSILEVGNTADECIYIKSDGSLNDGMEIVTHPMSLEYASTAGIMHKALKAVSLNHLNYEMIEVQDGEILKISKNGCFSRDTFTLAPSYSFGRYSGSIFGWEDDYPESTDDYAILLEMCGYFGVAPEEVQQLIDLGFSYDEIERLLWEPEGVEGELTTA
jgi:hypothetical protein